MQKPLILSVLLGVAAATASAQDPAAVAAKQCSVAFENDYVRVLRWSVAPGDEIPMHEHPAVVGVALTGGNTRYTLADGKTKEVTAKAGQASWSEPESHSARSLSTAPTRLLQVELKKSPDASMTGVAASEDPVAVDAKHYKVEFQNEHVRVLRIHYGPKEKSVMHSHPAAVAVFLTDASAKFAMPDGMSMPMDRKAGDVQWSDKGSHLPENTSAKPFELLLVELK